MISHLDHLYEARAFMGLASEATDKDQPQLAAQSLEKAAVHALIAIAEGLENIGWALDSIESNVAKR